jgi:hypothetical protein
MLLFVVSGHCGGEIRVSLPEVLRVGFEQNCTHQSNNEKINRSYNE